MSIDFEVPSKAHELDHHLPQRWKNYHAVNLNQTNPNL